MMRCSIHARTVLSGATRHSRKLLRNRETYSSIVKGSTPMTCGDTPNARKESAKPHRSRAARARASGSLVTRSLSMKCSGEEPPSSARSRWRSARFFQRSGSGLRYANRGAASRKNAGMSAGMVVAATRPMSRWP